MAISSFGNAIVVWSGNGPGDSSGVMAQFYKVNAGSGLSNMKAGVPHGFGPDGCGHDHDHDDDHDNDHDHLLHNDSDEGYSEGPAFDVFSRAEMLGDARLSFLLSNILADSFLGFNQSHGADPEENRPVDSTAMVALLDSYFAGDLEEGDRSLAIHLGEKLDKSSAMSQDAFFAWLNDNGYRYLVHALVPSSGKVREVSSSYQSQ